MITLHFSECCKVPNLPEMPEKIEICQPRDAHQRGDYYERMLTRAAGSEMEFVTYDELCVLVAQHLHRKGIINIQLCSWCACIAEPGVPRIITLDTWGDMNEDPHHGFFNQRMKYLR